MMTQERIVQRLRQHYPFLAREFKVKRIGLFGSVAQGRAREDSDVDLLVEFEQPIGLRFVALAEYLERVLQAKVDLLTPAGLAGIRHPEVAQAISEQIVDIRATDAR